MDLNDELLRQLAADTDSVRDTPLTRSSARFGPAARSGEASDSDAESGGAGRRGRRRRSGVDPITALRKDGTTRTSEDIAAIEQWLREVRLRAHVVPTQMLHACHSAAPQRLTGAYRRSVLTPHTMIASADPCPLLCAVVCVHRSKIRTCSASFGACAA